ncbi:Carbohydrate ABC transporter membrane protein 1 (CUT1 family) OS=Ureibacillus acetophenoni OX=614649 GN=SAMN05877842_12212 PE=3 SV=1 [Ureibacillus acetophenoni]
MSLIKENIPNQLESSESVFSKVFSWIKVRPYVMVLPAIIFFALFYLYPIGYTIYLSLHEWNFVSPTKNFIGLENFAYLLADRGFQQVMINTTIYTVCTVFFTISISLLLAVWLNRNARVYSLVQAAIFSPHIISLVSISLLWTWIMDTNFGLLNWFIGLFGFDPIPWLTSNKYALGSLIAVAVWKGIGFNTLVFIAGLQSIPKDLYEAAELDQTSKWRVFRKITIPMLSPTLFFLTIIGMINSFQVFETINLMTSGGPINSTNTIVYYIYENGFRFFKIGYASAAGVILLIIVAILTLIYFKVLNKRVHYR